MAVRDDAAAAPADQTASPLRLDATGNVKVAIDPTSTVQVAIVNTPTATVAPALNAEGAVVRVVGFPLPISIPDDGTAVPVSIEMSNVTQVVSSRANAPVFVRGTDDLFANERLATFAEQQAQSTGIDNITNQQTDGSQRTIVMGGDKGATVAANVTSTDQGTDNQALDVQVWHNGSALDPTQIRALTEADIVGANLRVAAADVSDGNPVPVSDGGSSLTVDGTVTANIGTTGALALDATLTGGTQIAVAKGPIAVGATVGTERPVLLGGTDGTNAQMVNVDSTGAVRLQSSGLPGAAAPSRATHIGGTDGANLRALSVDTSGRANVNVYQGGTAVSATAPLRVLSTASELSPSWVRGPHDAFGLPVNVEPTPVIQAAFCYGAPADTWTSYTTLTGTVTSTAVSSSLATVSTGANASAIAELTTLSRFSYRAGQGLRLRFTSLFSAPAIGGTQVVGVGPYDGFGVGYNGTSFGFLRRSGGRPEFRTITITTASTTNENVTVTLDGVATLVAVTNSGNTVTTAREIASGNYSAAGPGWDAVQTGSTVLFVARRPNARSGSYSLTATTAVGAFVQTLAGVAPTDTWTAKTAWNGDRLDGSLGANNASGATLDPTKLSVWQVLIPYLGAGNIVLQWQDPTTNLWTTCHTITYPNTATEPSVRIPNFQLWLYATGAANISAASASMALFLDGRVEAVGPRFAVPPSFKTTVPSANELPIVSVRCDRIYNGAENRGGLKPVAMMVSAGATGDVMLRVYRNATLTAYNYSAINAITPASYDTSATAATGGTLIGAIVTAPSGGSTVISLVDFGYDIEPGDVVTITAQQTNGVNGRITIALTGIHDSGNGSN